MWNVPTEKQLAKIPEYYSTEKIPLLDKQIAMHFFLGSCDWYVVEYDKENEIFFGFVNLGNEACAEWGDFSLQELKEIKVSGFLEVDRDIHWKVRPAREVAVIHRCTYEGAK